MASSSILHAHKVGRIRALGRYFRDDQASIFGKGFVLFAVAYVIFPLDAIPDVAPVIGWLDDLGVVALALLHLSRVLDRYRDPPALAFVRARA
jgi:uncharacterized membrane protein YkvA (DUF1232 family)